MTLGGQCNFSTIPLIIKKISSVRIPVLFSLAHTSHRMSDTSAKPHSLTLSPNWTGCLSAPPSAWETRPAGLLLLQGKLACEKQDLLGKVAKDVYSAVASVGTSTDVPCEIVGCGSKTRGAIRPEPYRVRLIGDRIEVKVVCGNRAPMALHLTGLVVPINLPPTPLIPRPSSSACLSAVALTCHQSGSWVVLAGHAACPPTPGFREFSSLLPPSCRPSRELEFLVPHQTVSMCKVYPDGRIVVDAGRPAGTPGQSALAQLRGAVQLGAVRFSTDDSSAVSVRNLYGGKAILGQPLVVVREGGLCMLQGKLSVDVGVKSHDIAPPRDLDEDRELELLCQIDSELRPSEALSWFVLNRLNADNVVDRTSRVVIDQNGYVWGSGFEPGIVREVSLSGLAWAPGAAPAAPLLPPFETRLTETDRAALLRSATEGIEDYTIRLKIADQFDYEKFANLILKKKFFSSGPGGVTEPAGWAARLLERYPAPPTSGMEAEAEVVAKEAMEGWNLGPVLDRLKSLAVQKAAAVHAGEGAIASAMTGSMGLVRRAVAPVSLQAVRASMTDMLRFNGSKCAHQMRVLKKASREELEALEEIVYWWHQWSSNDRHLSHSSLMGNQDIFADTGKWTIPDDPAIQQTVFRHMAWIYKRGYDTFISEIQTPLFPLIEDLDMESTLQMEDTSQIDQMFLDDDFLFIKERARALKVIYPDRDEFTCYIYSGSGFNKSKGRWKSSFHLVWPDVIVNGELAPIIRQTTVEYFIYRSAATQYFKRMQARLVNHFDANIWENVFDQTTSNANNGLRMPYCNKASWVKTPYGSKIPFVENRRCYPKGEITIKFEKTQFQSPELEAEARARAMRLIEETEARDAIEMRNQNELVGDRTQIKQSDKNTIHRTSAFIAGMKSMGGDLRDLWKVSAEWARRVEDPEALSEEETALWIQRGSCRRPMNVTRLSEYNQGFVDCYLKADLVWFEGHTIESLRETEKYKKLTPAGQQGLKVRFRKYLQAQAGGGFVAKRPGMDDVARLHELAQRVRADRREAQKSAESSSTKLLPDLDDVSDGAESIVDSDEELPPMGADQEMFEMWPENSIDNVFRFTGEAAEWQTRLAAAGKGYWVHCPFALVWVSPRAVPSDGWGPGMQGVMGGRRDMRNQQVTVGLYTQCGKVVVNGDKTSAAYKRVIEVVQSIAEPDDRIYHRLQLPDASEEGYFSAFPLIDRKSAQTQREEYERRWDAMRAIDRDALAAGESSDYNV